MTRCIVAATVSLFFLLADFQALLGQDWPHWRGPTRDGISPEDSGWIGNDWLSETPDWQAQIGSGASSPLIYRGRVYVLGWTEKKDSLRCLDLKNGKEEWSQTYSCPSHGRFHKGEEFHYGGPSSTPEIDTQTGLLYTLSIDGDLNCWDISNKGQPVWSLNLYRQYDVKQRPKLTPIYHRDYGYTSSPLVHGEWLVVEVGSTKNGTYVAFDKRTGKEVWRSELKDESGHSGGLVPMTIDNIPCFVGFTQRHVAIVRLDREKIGATLAKTPWVTEGCCNLATPVAVGNSILVTSAYNQNAITRFDVDRDKGMTEVWKRQLPSKVCSPVVHDGAIYFSWMQVYCLDWKTGEKRWSGGSFGDAGSCVVTSDGRLVVYGHMGKIALIEGAARSPTKYKQLAVLSRVFQATAWPHVAIGSQRVVCRDKNGNLACFSLPAPKAK